MTGLILTGAHVASAADKPLSKKEANARASELVAQAKAAFVDKRFDEAADLYMQAFKLANNPAAVYDAARAKELGGVVLAADGGAHIQESAPAGNRRPDFILDRIAMTRGHGVACHACWLVRWVGRKRAPTATRRSLVTSRFDLISRRLCRGAGATGHIGVGRGRVPFVSLLAGLR